MGSQDLEVGELLLFWRNFHTFFPRLPSGTGILVVLVILVVKSLPANAGDVRDTGSTPGSGRYSGGGHGNPLQYSCLRNTIAREALWTTIHRVTMSQT